MENEEKSGITRIRVKNFRSIADSSLELGPTTVMVGPNGSGKSNFLDAVAFLSDALRTNLETAFSARQGFEAVRMREGEPGSVEMGVRYENGELGIRLDYDFTVKGNADGGCRVTRERVEFRTIDGKLLPSIEIQNGNLVSPEELIREIGKRFEGGDTDFYTDNLAMPTISRLIPRLIRRPAPRLIPRQIRQLIHRGTSDDVIRWIYVRLYTLQNDLAQLRVYRLFPNTMRQPQMVRNPRPLDPDGGNLGSVLWEMDKKHPDSMGRLKKILRHIVPFITDLRVVPAGGFLITQLKHGDVFVKNEEDAWFDLTQESDGTVRTLGILTALYQQPYLPLIGIEEPELNVHPGALEALGESILEASRRSQMLITTHNPDLIDVFRVENILVVDSEHGITTADFVSEIQIETVREKLFSLGELHSMEGLKPAGSAR